jgi:hypothetical protein
MGKKMLSVVTVLIASTFALTACSSPAEDASTSAVSEVDRNALETEPKLVAITNNTGGDITLSISGTDNFDWEGSRPDHRAPEGFQGTLLAFGKTETRSLTQNFNADGAPFTINFGDTGASVELSTGNMCGTWSLRGKDPASCRLSNSSTTTVESAGYTITVDTELYGSPNTNVTITK